VRLFIAINFPDEVRLAIHVATEPLRVAAPEIRWVDVPRIHLTMKFLGEHPETAIAPLAAALAAVASRYDPIGVELGGLNAFPNLRQPRVVWLGVKADPKLELLHHDVESACAALGHPVDARAYRPHVTLGRVKEWPLDPVRIAAAARAIDFEAALNVDALDLMVSEQADGRPSYRLVGSATLGRE
jgi:2'-5' RNA ligase